jgi:hypothetical protein
MKFGKLLKETTEGMPEMEDLFLRYKELKKHLKAMKKAQPEIQAVAAAHDEELEETSTSGNQEHGLESRLSVEEMAFVNTLNEDLQRFNRFFIDKEEDSVIKLQALSDRIKAATQPDELQSLKAELVDFHGEMVLLLHWSLFNYAAVVKILKKHDKRSGLLLRAPYLANVLQQPFYSTSIMSRLVKSAEEHINTLVIKQQSAGSSPESSPPAAAAPAEGSATPDAVRTAAVTPRPVTAAAGDAESNQVPSSAAVDEDAAANGPTANSAEDEEEQEQQQQLPVDTAVFARTRMALQTWDTLCNNASTPSTVLPAGSGELVRQLQVRERWAKIVGVPHSEAAPAGAEEEEREQQAEVGAAAAAADSTAAAVGSRKQQRHDELADLGHGDARAAAAVSKKQRC